MRSAAHLYCAVMTYFLPFAVPAMADHDGNGKVFIDKLNDIKTVASTVPSNGDVNPYGVAIAPVTRGALVEGHVLVSNFNAASNLQGTGSTIVGMSPQGALKLSGADCVGDARGIHSA